MDQTLSYMKQVRKPDDLANAYNKLVQLKQQMSGVFRHMQHDFSMDSGSP